jgi:hypothetical protein
MRQQLLMLWVDPVGIELHERIGIGSSGAVYRGTDGNGRTLAIKVLPRTELSNNSLAGLLEAGGEEAAMLRRELVLWQRVNQGTANICR